MKVTVYLPDDVYRRAREVDGMNFSRMLRDAVTAELDRRDDTRRSSDPQEVMT